MTRRTQSTGETPTQSDSPWRRPLRAREMVMIFAAVWTLGIYARFSLLAQPDADPSAQMVGRFALTLAVVLGGVLFLLYCIDQLFVRLLEARRRSPKAGA
jgi:hypothetical protein